MIAVMQNMAFGASVGLAGPGQPNAVMDPPTVPGDGSFFDVLLQADVALDQLPQDGLPEVQESELLIESSTNISLLPFFISALIGPSPAPGMVVADVFLPVAADQVAIPELQTGDMTAGVKVPPVAENAIVADQGPQTSTAVATLIGASNVVKNDLPVTEVSVDPIAAPNAPTRPAMAAQGLDRDAATPATTPLSVDPSVAPPPIQQTFDPVALEGEKGLALGKAPDARSVVTAINATPDAAVFHPNTPALDGSIPSANAYPARPALEPAPTQHVAAPDAAPQVSVAEAIWRQKWDANIPAQSTIADPVARPQKPTPSLAGLMPEMPREPLAQSPDTPIKAEKSLPSAEAKSAVNPMPEQTAPLVTKSRGTKHQDPAVIEMPVKAGAGQAGAAQAGSGQSGSGQAAPDPISIIPVETGLLPSLGPTAPSSAPISGAPIPIAPPAPVAASNLAPAIVEMARMGKDGPIELALAPEELGRLTISLRQEGDFVRVSMITERPETLDLLRRHAGDLLADLRQSGFSGASFSFGQSGQDQTQQFADRTFDAEDAAPAQSTPLDFKQSTPSLPHQGAGLDLRF